MLNIVGPYSTNSTRNLGFTRTPFGASFNASLADQRECQQSPLFATRLTESFFYIRALHSNFLLVYFFFAQLRRFSIAIIIFAFCFDTSVTQTPY